MIFEVVIIVLYLALEIIPQLTCDIISEVKQVFLS